MKKEYHRWPIQQGGKRLTKWHVVHPTFKGTLLCGRYEPFLTRDRKLMQTTNRKPTKDLCGNCAAILNK